MAFLKRKTDEELQADWNKLGKKKWTWILVKGVISYGLPLGLAIYLMLYVSDSIPKDDIVPLVQIMGLFLLYGMGRAYFRYDYFNKKFGRHE